MNKYLKYGLWSLAGVALLIVLSLSYIALTFDPNSYKSKIIQSVKESKQRTLKLDGDIKLHFFPSIGVNLGKVSLSEFQSEQEFASLESAIVSLKLMPLLSKQIIVDEVNVGGVKVQVIKHKNGKFNFDDLLNKDPVPAAQASASASSTPPLVFDIAAVRLNQTELNFSDEASGAHYSVKDLALKTGRIANAVPTKIDFAAHIQSNQPKLDVLTQLKATITFDLGKSLFDLQGLDLQTKGSVLDIADLLVQASGDASAELAGQEFALKKFSLNASGIKGKEHFEAKLLAPALSLTKDKFSVDGVALNAKLDAAFGNVVAALSLPTVEGNAEKFKLSGMSLDVDVKQPEQAFKLKVTTPISGNLKTRQFNLSDLLISVNATGEKLPGKSISSELKGSVQADLGRQSIQANLAGGLLQSQLKVKVAVSNFAVPAIRYDLEIDQFDADPFIPKPVTDTGAKEKQKPEAEQPFDLTALKALNVEGSLRVGTLKVDNVKVNQLRIDVKAKGGIVKVEPFSANLYKGSIVSNIILNASSAQPEFAVNAKLNSIDIGPLLVDVLKMDILNGKANVALNLATQGNLVSLLKKNLNGLMSVVLADGAVKGVNLAKSVREFGAGGSDKTQSANKEEKTDFTEMKASFKINKGIAHNDDLTLKSPFVRVGGKGDINLDNDSLDYLVKATIAGTTEGQGGKDIVGGLTVPVRLSGPFTALQYKFEFGSMVSDAAKQKASAVAGAAKQKAQQAINANKDQAKAKVQEELKKGLKGLFK